MLILYPEMRYQCYSNKGGKSITPETSPGMIAALGAKMKCQALSSCLLALILDDLKEPGALELCIMQMRSNCMLGSCFSPAERSRLFLWEVWVNKLNHSL
jgi:hypothetical protein